MSSLSSAARDNRMLLLGLGVTACAVLGLMRHMLIVYRDSLEVKKPSPITQYITQSTEDSLKTTTLEKLAESHNYGIQETAARIVCDRALHDGATLHAILRELTEPDHDRREQAIRAVFMLSEQPGMEKLNIPSVYSAVVTCLAHCVQDTTHESYDKEIDNFDFRDPAERFSLLVLFRLAHEFGPKQLIKAGFVRKWLAKEPWGNTEEEKQSNFRHLREHERQRLSLLIQKIADDPMGFDQLLKANLVVPSDSIYFNRPINSETLHEDASERELGGSDVVSFEGGPRPREQSAEERHLRRRHREAMVLNDGTQPIGVGSIIEREYESPVEERRP